MPGDIIPADASFLHQLNPELLDRLRKLLERARQGGMSHSRFKAMFSDGRIFNDFCRREGASWLPASPESVAKFVEEMTATRKPATIQRYLSTISRWHSLAGLPTPTRDEDVRMARKADLRHRHRRQRQAAPLREDKLQIIEANLLADAQDNDDAYALAALRDYALLKLANATICRSAELVSFLREDFIVEQDGSARLLMRQSKGDQEGEGRVKWIDPDTVNAVLVWLDAHDAELARRRVGEEDRQAEINNKRFPQVRYPQGRKRTRARRMAIPLEWIASPFIFRGLFPKYYYKTVTGDDGKPSKILERAVGWSDKMDTSSVRRILKRRVSEAGTDPSGYSGHSTRIGAYQDLLEDGESLPSAVLEVGWKTARMGLRYGENILAARGAVARRWKRRHGLPVDSEDDTGASAEPPSE